MFKKLLIAIALIPALILGPNAVANIVSTDTYNLGSLTASNTWSGQNLFTALTTFGSAHGANNSIALNEVTGAITFDGATGDTNEIRLSAGDPSADQTYGLQAVCGSLNNCSLAGWTAQISTAIVYWGANFDLTAEAALSWIVASDTLQIEAVDAANAISIGNDAGSIIFEGASADDFETTIDSVDATADATFLWPALTAATRYVVSATGAGSIVFTGPGATTRTITLVDADQTLANLGSTQTFSAVKTFSAAPAVTLTSGDANVAASTSGTANYSAWRVTNDQGASGATGYWAIYGSADANTVFGLVDANHVHVGASGSTLAGMFIGPVTADPIIMGALSSQRVYVEDSAKSLTDGSLTAFVQVAVAQGTMTGGRVDYTCTSADGATIQSSSGTAVFSAVNEAGTEACTFTEVAAEVEVSPTGTLTIAVDCQVGLTDVVNLRMNCDSSFASPTTTVTYVVVKNAGAGVITPQ